MHCALYVGSRTQKQKLALDTLRASHATSVQEREGRRKERRQKMHVLQTRLRKREREVYREAKLRRQLSPLLAHTLADPLTDMFEHHRLGQVCGHGDGRMRVSLSSAKDAQKRSTRSESIDDIDIASSVASTEDMSAYAHPSHTHSTSGSEAADEYGAGDAAHMHAEKLFGRDKELQRLRRKLVKLEKEGRKRERELAHLKSKQSVHVMQKQVSVCTCTL